MAFSLTAAFAAVPLPVLVGVPIVGLVAAVAIYEYEKHKAQAAASSLASVSATPPPSPAPTPTGAEHVHMASIPAISAFSLAHAVPMPGKPGTVLLPIIMRGGTAPPAGSSPMSGNGGANTPTGQLVLMQQQATQMLSSLPSPFPGDVFGGLYEQITHAALNQFIANPTQAQFNTTLSALGNASTSAPNVAAVQSAYQLFQRYSISIG